MEQAATTFSGDGGLPRTPEQIQREIDQTREELAGTVAAVVERLNLKRRARERAHRSTEAARDRALPVAVGAVAITATAVVAWVVIRKRSETRWDRVRAKGRRLAGDGSLWASALSR